MKKIILSAALAVAVLTSCGGVSEKGNWNEEDKKKADDAIAEIDSELDAFGDAKQEFIDCYLDKVEANYASFAEADADLSGCEKLATECAEDVMGL